MLSLVLNHLSAPRPQASGQLCHQLVKPLLPSGTSSEAFPQSHCKRRGFSLWVGKIPWRREWQPTSVLCLENSMDRRAWQAAVHGVAESQTRLSTHTHSCCLCHNCTPTPKSTRPGVSTIKPCPDLCAAPALSNPLLHMT